MSGGLTGGARSHRRSGPWLDRSRHWAPRSARLCRVLRGPSEPARQSGRLHAEGLGHVFRIYVNVAVIQGRTAHSTCVAMPIGMNGFEVGIVIIFSTSCPQYPMFAGLQVTFTYDCHLWPWH